MSDTVNSLMASQGQDAAAGADAAGGADPSGGGMSASTLKSLKMGGSAIAAVSKFGLAMSKATAISSEADQQFFGARQELLQAQEVSGEIQRALVQTVAAQQGVAAAGGVDIASGSVVEAGRQATITADRAARVTRNSADMNAALRRARGYALKQQAGVQRLTGFLNLATDIASMAVSAGGGAPGG